LPANNRELLHHGLSKCILIVKIFLNKIKLDIIINNS